MNDEPEGWWSIWPLLVLAAFVGLVYLEVRLSR